MSCFAKHTDQFFVTAMNSDEIASTDRMSDDAVVCELPGLSSTEAIPGHMSQIQQQQSSLNTESFYSGTGCNTEGLSSLTKEELAEWSKWQASITSHCLQTKWIRFDSVNCVIAPFALSITSIMLQKAATGDTHRILEEFTTFCKRKKDLLKKCFPVMTHLFRDTYRPSASLFSSTEDRHKSEAISGVMSSAISDTTVDPTSCTLDDATAAAMRISYQLITANTIEVQQPLKDFIFSAFHQKITRMKSSNPKQFSSQIVDALSELSSFDIQKAFAVARAQRKKLQLEENSKMPIPRLCTDKTTLVAICGTRIDAFWVGEKISSERIKQNFLLAYGVKQKQLFFGLKAKIKTCAYNMFQMCAIPLNFGSEDSSQPGNSTLSFSLLVIRPQFTGELYTLLELMNRDILLEVLSRLDSEEVEDATILLPCVKITSLDQRALPLDLCDQWFNNGSNFSRLVSKTAADVQVPPILEHLFHYASIQIDEEGVHFAKNTNNDFVVTENVTQKPTSFGLKVQRSIAFNYRFDSPFIYLVVETSTKTSLLCGCYAGISPIPWEKLRKAAPKNMGKWLKKATKKRCGCRNCCDCC